MASTVGFRRRRERCAPDRDCLTDKTARCACTKILYQALRHGLRYRCNGDTDEAAEGPEKSGSNVSVLHRLSPRVTPEDPQNPPLERVCRFESDLRHRWRVDPNAPMF